VVLAKGIKDDKDDAWMLYGQCALQLITIWQSQPKTKLTAEAAKGGVA
jgi:hypothetical protein